MVRSPFTFTVVFLIVFFASSFTNPLQETEREDIISYVVDPKTTAIDFYWKDEAGNVLKSLENLKNYVERKNQKLIFAANAGMYKKDNSPRGLYIERGKLLAPLDTTSGAGNFYLKPNGVFYITTNDEAGICRTEEFPAANKIKYATQSGPMLVIAGEIHPAFNSGSSNLNIRNGVGILPDKRVVFAMSKKEINFFDFASYFRGLGCKEALYLDGFVSRTYFPEKNWIQTDGNFGVMIGVVKR